MIRDIIQTLRVRGENVVNNLKETKVLKLDDEDNESKTNNNNKPRTDVPVSKLNNTKPQTSDAAVGDDDKPINENAKKKHQFLHCFRFRKKKEPENIPEEDAMEKFVHRVEREAFIATREVVASTCSSLFAVFLSHPFDVVKSQYQLLRYPRTIQSPYFRRRRFVYVLQNIYITKGLSRFYKHIWKSQQESALNVITVFWTYQRVRQFFQENFDIFNEDAANFVAGFVSATIPVLVLHPYQNYRERQEIKHKLLRKVGKSTSEGFVKQLKYWRPFYHGSSAMFLHLSMLYGLRFTFYHKIRDKIAHDKTTIDKATDTNPYVTEVDTIINFSNWELLLAGALAAILSDILTHPLDVIRSRLQMTALMRQQYRYNETCRSFFQCVKLILKKERFSAFYAGLTPCLIRSTVSTALTFAVHDKMREWLRPFFPS